MNRTRPLSHQILKTFSKWIKGIKVTPRTSILTLLEGNVEKNTSGHCSTQKFSTSDPKSVSTKDTNK